MSRQTPLSVYLLLAMSVVVMAGPLLWMVTTSFKPAAEITATPYKLLPERLCLENYPDAVATISVGRCLTNSIVLCVGSVLGTVASCSVVAYGFSRLRWPGRDLVFGMVIATMLLPWQATMIPRFLLIRELGLYNSLAALIVPTFLCDAFYIFLFRQFFRNIPQELIDAARADGCGEWTIFWRIVLPLSTPALATVALLQFVAVWNDYGGPLLYLSDPQKFPLAYGLEQFVSSHSSETNLLMAAALLFTLPIIAIFLLTQRTFLRGIVTTGLKDS